MNRFQFTHTIGLSRFALLVYILMHTAIPALCWIWAVLTFISLILALLGMYYPDKWCVLKNDSSAALRYIEETKRKKIIQFSIFIDILITAYLMSHCYDITALLRGVL